MDNQHVLVKSGNIGRKACLTKVGLAWCSTYRQSNQKVENMNWNCCKKIPWHWPLTRRFVSWILFTGSCFCLVAFWLSCPVVGTLILNLRIINQQTDVWNLPNDKKGLVSMSGVSSCPLTRLRCEALRLGTKWARLSVKQLIRRL